MLICDEELSSPSLFVIMQVYLPLAAFTESMRVPFLVTTALNDLPSPLLHRIFGLGTPVKGHLIRTVVFKVAVTLSPTVAMIGLPSPVGIFFPFVGCFIRGLVGSKQP